MLSVLVLGGTIGWLSHRARVQRLAVQAIERGGGHVLYDWQYDGSKWDIRRPPPGPRRLASAVGVDFLGHALRVTLGPRDVPQVMDHVGRLTRVESLTVNGRAHLTDADLARLKGLVELTSIRVTSRVATITRAGLNVIAALPNVRVLELPGVALTDDDLKPLETLTTLERLQLMSPRITDAGLVHLRGLVRLKSLSLVGAKVKGVGLANLAGMTKLERLELGESQVADVGAIRALPMLMHLGVGGTPIDDAGIAAFAQPGSLPNLKILWASNTRLTDTGLKSLRALPSLENINVEGTVVSNAGLVNLGSMPSMHYLSLGRTSITDAGLARLTHFPALTLLSLRQTVVTDAGLKSLTGLKHLERVRLAGTRVTDAGVSELQAAIPKLRVER